MDEKYKKKLDCERICGAEELRAFVSSLHVENFMPGIRRDKYVQDSHDFSILKNGNFKANLHVHTRNSDGAGKTEQLLLHAEAIAKYNSRFNSQFMLAITDHDTINGAREAFEIFRDNPDRFQHLKFVPGLEISTVETKLEQQTAPNSIHLLVYGINPYDRQLDEFLKEKSRLKLELTQKTLTELNRALSKDLGFEFTLPEAALVHEMIAKGFDEVRRPLMKYTTAKILHNYYIKNPDFTYEKPVKKYKELFRSSEPYCIAYKKALEQYTGQELPPVSQEIENVLQKAQSIYEKAHPTMETTPAAFSSFEETVKFISSLEYGVMAVAHPARININCIKSSPEDIFTNIFENFKSAGGEKAMLYEGYYGSYFGERAISLLPEIDRAAEKFRLIPSGGLDSHGRDVITRTPYS